MGAMEQLTRDQAISFLRRVLIAASSPGESTCELTAERNWLCRGFCRDRDSYFRARYALVIDTDGPRSEVEARANAYQLRRQREEGALLSCDVQYRFYETCRGWNDFSNEDLVRFCREVTGLTVAIGGDAVPAVL